jgi:hypothetical protein
MGQIINIEEEIREMDGNIKRTIESFVSLALAKGANIRELKAFLQGLVGQLDAKIEESGS